MVTINEMERMIVEIAKLIDPMCWATDPGSMTANMLFRRRDALRKASEILDLVKMSV